MSITQEYIAKRNELLGNKVAEALKRRGYEPYYVKTAAEANELILSLIPEGSSIGWGGSMTLDDMGIKDQLRAGNYTLFDRDVVNTPEEKQEMMRKSLTSDVFLSSVNAMTQDGEMINIDGNGNRIAAIAYGPKNVILAVGMNKVCPDLQSAKARARSYAAPINCLKLGIELPCTKNGTCNDCSHPQCACAQMVYMRMNRIPGRIKVVLIGEEMGL